MHRILSPCFPQPALFLTLYLAGHMPYFLFPFLSIFLHFSCILRVCVMDLLSTGALGCNFRYPSFMNSVILVFILVNSKPGYSRLYLQVLMPLVLRT